MAASKILLTTSRNPTLGIRTFCNEFARMIPNAVRVNRGKMNIDEVAEKALDYEADRVVVVERRHGGPGDIKLFRIGEAGLVSFPPIMHVAGIKLQREFEESSVRPAGSIVVVKVSCVRNELLRITDALSSFFNVPIKSIEESSDELETLICLSQDRAGMIVMTFMSEPNHVEVGPRILVSSLEW